MYFVEVSMSQRWSQWLWAPNKFNPEMNEKCHTALWLNSIPLLGVQIAAVGVWRARWWATVWSRWRPWFLSAQTRHKHLLLLTHTGEQCVASMHTTKVPLTHLPSEYKWIFGTIKSVAICVISRCWDEQLLTYSISTCAITGSDVKAEHLHVNNNMELL